MLEITGNDISELSDSDLRTLIGLLCEAELSSQGIQTTGVTWGGNQDAPDGGIDVRVETSSILQPDSYIPRPVTGFQVKKSDMRPSSIISEMRPKDQLRDVIVELVKVHGAYIIASSGSSTTDSVLLQRKNAMQKALNDVEGGEEIYLDFYDKNRIASWARSQTSLIFWVKNKIGKAVQGWQSYGNWSKTPDNVSDKYLVNDDLTVRDLSGVSTDSINTVEALNKIRNILRTPNASVRLTGLSGVGKTKFVQTLFDDRIGVDPLNKSSVVYADVSSNPSPEPVKFIEQLTLQRQHIVVVIDNCSPELHKQIVSICKTPGCYLSAITVEYDIRDDQPEETKVFRLEPATAQLLEDLIKIRFHHISRVDVQSIANFSGGNARIAIALASTVGKNESISNFNDEELFKRLFFQRNEHSDILLRAAEVCSLVYSFNSQVDLEGSETNEMSILASAAEITPIQLHGYVAELHRRELIQDRGVWRAVLPHALANRLAKRSLENIPSKSLLFALEKDPSGRLLRSFSRRLGYLHDSEIAQSIVGEWLSKDGLLHEVNKLDDVHVAILENIAPVNPGATLNAFISTVRNKNNPEFTTRENAKYSQLTRILRSLAYDSDLFEKAAELLCEFAVSENPDEYNNSKRSMLFSLFHIRLSGTHATAEQRLNVIKKQINSSSTDHQNIGLEMIDHSLEAWHFSSHYSFDFGARTRDYGYYPKTNDEVQEWFITFADYALEIALLDNTLGARCRTILAGKIRGLWVKAGLHNYIEKVVKVITEKMTWNEGWVAIKTLMRFHFEKMNDNEKFKVTALENILSPVSLIDKARLYALTPRLRIMDLIDIEDLNNKISATDNLNQIASRSRDIGKKVIQDESVFNVLLPDIFTSAGSEIFSFAQGIAEGCNEPDKVWDRLIEQFKKVPRPKRNYRSLLGFINVLSDININACNRILDSVVDDIEIGYIFPELQSNVVLADKKAVKRLLLSLELELADIISYQFIGYGRWHKAISDDDLIKILKQISNKKGGHTVAIEALSMRFHDTEDKNYIPSSSIISYGQLLLLISNDIAITDSSGGRDYNYKTVINQCLAGKDKDTVKITIDICRNISLSISKRHFYVFTICEALNAIATLQPMAFLDGMFGWVTDLSQIGDLANYFGDDTYEIDIFSNISVDTIVQWCEKDAELRYVLITSCIMPFQKDTDGNITWTPLCLQLIERAPDELEILNILESAFRPMSWSGSRAKIMQERLNLFITLEDDSNPIISDWAKDKVIFFRDEIKNTLEHENNSTYSGSFE